MDELIPLIFDVIILIGIVKFVKYRKAKARSKKLQEEIHAQLIRDQAAREREDSVKKQMAETQKAIDELRRHIDRKLDENTTEPGKKTVSYCDYCDSTFIGNDKKCPFCGAPMIRLSSRKPNAVIFKDVDPLPASSKKYEGSYPKDESFEEIKARYESEDRERNKMIKPILIIIAIAVLYELLYYYL